MKREWTLPDREDFETIVFDGNSSTIRLCQRKEHRIPDDCALLLLDATADKTITQKLVGEVDWHAIDIEQQAIVTQVFDRTGSNTFWASRAEAKDQLVAALNAWTQVGLEPLCISNKTLADEINNREDLDENVRVMNFGGLRGSNAAENADVVFITGRNQPPSFASDYAGRALFWDDLRSLQHDDLTEDLPKELRGYWQSKHNTYDQSGVYVRSFSDNRIEAVHRLVRESETVQAIARLRLVHAPRPKRVFLLGNLPVEIPVDRFVEFKNLMPNKLERELLDRGELPITANAMLKLRGDLCRNKDQARKALKGSTVTSPELLLKALPDLARYHLKKVTYRAGDIRKTTQEHLFLAEQITEEDGFSMSSAWPLDEIRELLLTGWDEIVDLQLDFAIPGEPTGTDA